MSYNVKHQSGRRNLGEKAIPADFLTNDNYNVNDMGKEFVEKCFPWRREKPDVTVSQIRKLLSAVNSIQNKITADESNYNKGEVQYLRVKLAYQAGREPKLKKMQEELDPIIAGIRNAKQFKKFARLIEAIIAYHKFYGGGN